MSRTPETAGRVEMEKDRDVVSIEHPRASLLLGVVYMAAGILVLIAGVYNALATPWPKGAMYLLLVVTSWWVFKDGMQRARSAFRSAAHHAADPQA